MNKQNLIETHQRIAPYIHKTPVLTSTLINEISGVKLFFKCENFQKMGAFKMRGAVNAILNLTEKQKDCGVVTHSSGNFAQALSLAARNLGVKAYVVMPKNTLKVKKDAVRGYGGTIIESENNIISRGEVSKQLQAEKNLTFIHSANDKDVIIGQGTAAMELLENHPNLDYIFTPIGGGGLIAGTALAAKYFSESCEVIGGEPFEVDDAYRSLLSGKIETNKTTNTIADGLKVNLGDINFPIIKAEVKKIIRVEEDEIITAMKLIWERLKIVIEPSSAVPFAALLREKDNYKNKNIGIIISGGNVDLSNLPF